MKHFNFIVNRNGGCGAHTGKEANTPPCCSERASRFVWVLVLMLTIGIGQMWGATETIFQETFGDNGSGSSSNTAVGSATCYTATTSMFTEGHQTSVVSNYSSNDGTKVGKNNVNASNNTGASGKSAIWRQAGSGTNNNKDFFTIQNINISGYTSLSLKFNLFYLNGIGSGKNNTIIVKYKIDNGTETQISFTPTSLSASTWTWCTGSISGTGNSLQLKFYHSTNGGYTARIDDIILTGTASTPVSTPSITPSVTELDWGTVNKGTGLNTKTFTITGSNLTAADLVYSASDGYSVSPEGKDGAAGTLSQQTITVTPPSTATPGTYNSTVTISGGGLSTPVSVAVKLKVQQTDEFIDEVQGTAGYTSASPHIEGGTYSTPTITDKVAAMSGTCEQQHYHFVGWITAAKYEAGTFIAAGDLQTPTSATGATYYAVWAKQGAGGGGTTYTLVTAASQLSTGDKVVLVDGNPTSTCNGVTGWNGTKDATISSTAANWVQYNVTKSNDVWTLKDATANKFIQSPSGNEFIYDDVGGSFEADEDGWVSCNSRYLSINSSMYRFYTYSSISTNSYDVFYMYKVGSSITYTDYIAQCCTSLGSINGSVSCTSGTAATLSWDAVTGAESYKVKVPGSTSHNDWTTATSGVSVTGLTAGQNYTAYFQAFDSDGTHCTEGPESTTAFTTPKITVTGTPSAMSYNQGSGPSAPQSFTVAAVGMAGNVTVAAPTNFEVSTSNNSGFGSSVVLSPTSGTVSSTAIYVRLVSGLNVGSYPAAGTSNVTVSGNFATTVNVAVSGTVANPCSAAPTVSAATSSAKTMTSITVNCAGLTALGTGGCTIDHYGFVYGTSTAPKHPSDNSGTGIVKEVGTTYTTTGTAFGATTITGLTKATKYYIRPYAHNDCGWAYGDEIEVTTLDLKSLSVTAPTKVAYFQGETFASAGAVVTATYTDNSEATVTTSATWDLTTLSTAGEITATASYTENGTTKTATTTINVYTVTVNMVKEDGETPLTSGPSVSWTLNTKTIAANEGSSLYAFKQWNVTGATAANTGNASTTLSNPTGNVTATAVFYNPIDVAWKVGDGNASGGTTEVKYGAKVTALPTNPANNALAKCGTNVFKGWSKEEITETGHSAPSDLFTSTSDAGCTALTANTVYHAVFAKSENGTSTVTFDPANVTNTPETSTGSKIWRHASGVQMQLYGSSSRYTGGNPNTWTMSHNKGSYTVISAPTNITQITARSVYQYTSGYYTYNGWITDATPGTLSPTSFTQADADNYVDQTISNINATSVTLQDNSSAVGDQARVLSLTVTYATTNISDYMTNCCNELEDINGEVTWSDATTAVLTWDDLENVDGTTPYNVTYRIGSAAYGNTNVGSITTNAQGKRTCTITGLTPCANYDFMITANPADGYCEKDQTINDSQTHAWGVSFPTLTGTTKKSGDATSCATGNYVATFEAVSAAYELPTSDGVTVTIGNSTATLTTDYTWAVSEGVGTLTVLQASITGNIAISVVGVAHTCTDDPNLGDASLSGTLNLTTVGVSCEGIDPGSYCAVESGDYGFIWYAGTGDKVIGDDGVTKVAISTGDYTSGSFATNLSGEFSLGSTYTFRAFAKNTGSNVGYSDAVSFTLRSITFNKNNGEDNDVVYVNSGSAVAQPSNPSKTGYEFSKWQKEGSDYDFESPVSSNITLDAVYNANTYTVTLAKNYGSAGSSNVTATFGQNMPSMGDKPGREGYEFTGYYANNNGTGTKYYNEDKSSAHVWDQAEDKTIYAAWSPKNYTIILNNEDADTGHEGTESIAVTYDSNDNLTSAITKPEKNGYKFGGYFTETEGAGTQLIDEDGNVIASVSNYTSATKQWKKAGSDEVNLYAFWKACHTVTWSVNGEETPEVVVHGEKVAAMPTAPTSSDCDDAKKFVGWRAEAIEGVSASAPSGIFTDVDGSPEVTDDVTFYAVFADVTIGQSITLSFPDDNSANNGLTSSQYTSTWTAKAGTFGFTIKNFNNNNWNNWKWIRCGRGSSYASVASISTDAAVPFVVDSVLIEIATTDASKINSSKLYISANSDFSSSTDLDIPQSATTQKIVIASSAKDKYYKIVFDCQAKSNGFVQINSVVYKQKIDTSNYVTTCASCNEDATFTTALPAISNEDCTSATITATGGLATLGSEGCNISDYGFVYSLATDPEIDGDGVTKLQVGTSNPTIGDDFSQDLTGLTKGKHYYVRAYAVNKHGVAYSSTKDFWTKDLSSIAITTAPTKTNYIVGETFDATGMVVTATLAGGATEDITEDATYSNAALTAGVDQDFTISYTLCETEKTATQKINVYSVTVEEGENAENGEMSYNNAGTITVSNLAEHTTVSLDVENATIQDNGNGTFSIINPTGNVTVTVNYIEAVQVVVKYYVNGNELTGLAKNPYQSESFDMPDASAVASAMSSASINVGDVNFVGWSTTDFPYQTTEPTLAGASVSVTEATDYYAVFTNLESVQIIPDNFNGTKANNEGEKTYDGIKYNVHEMCKQSSQIQFGSGGYLYTKDAIQYISKVEITGLDLPVYACSNNSGSVDGNAITPTGTAPYVYAFPADKQYLKITDKNGTSKVSLIKIYYAPEAVYYTTQFQKLTFNKADGNKDKDEMVAKNKAYALTEDDAPTAVEHYTFLDKWTDSQNTYEIGDAVTMSTNVTLTPISAYETAGDTDIDGLPEGVTEIVVTDGTTLNVNADKTLDNLTVEAGGKVDNASNKLTVNNLYIKSEASKSGQVANASAAKLQADAIYMDVTFFKGANTLDATTAGRWYMISAPFDVNLSDGFTLTDGTAMHFGVDDNLYTFDLFEYDGKKRGETGVTGWKRVQGKMKAGTACLIGFNPGQPTTIRLKAASTGIEEKTSITLQAFDGDATNQNWNGVANPTLHYTNINKDVQTYNNEDGDNGRKYLPYTAASTSFVVGTAFFVQETGSISLSAATHDALRAPKRNADERIEYCVRITREGANDFADQMYVRASETASSEYEQGHDMITWNGTTGNTAMIWAENYGKRLAIEEAPLVSNQASYALGIFAPKAGTYRIAATSEDDADLYLTYEGSIIWNLSMGAYEIELNKGTTNGYGLLLQAKAPQVTTGVDEVDAETGVQKIIIDDHVYILRGGQMYDVTGKMVK